MKRSVFYVMIGFSTLVLSSCMTTSELAMTPLEIRAIQSREYEATKEVVFSSMISVFQDIGYTISNADIQTGLILAESAADNNLSFFEAWAGMTKVTQTKATAFVEQIGDKTKARLNFVVVKKSSSSQGQNSRKDTPILDSKLYENAFEKIETAIFIRSAN